jgi:3-methyladenine DNA glycosylase Tag
MSASCEKQKTCATIENARFVAELESSEGRFGRFLASWPGTDQTVLLNGLNKRGSRLGGATGKYFLRFAGWDAWITSARVFAALVWEGILDSPGAYAKRDLKKFQDAINEYHDTSGLPRAQIIRRLAMSVG